MSLGSATTENMKPAEKDVGHLPMEMKQVCSAEQESLRNSDDAQQIASTDARWTRNENGGSEGAKDYPTMFFASLARQLVRPGAKAGVLLLASALLSLGVWSAVNLDTEFKAEWLIDMESSFGRWLVWKIAVFNPFFYNISRLWQVVDPEEGPLP